MIASFITLVSFVNELITPEWQREVRNIAKEVVSAMKEAKSLTKLYGFHVRYDMNCEQFLKSNKNYFHGYDLSPLIYVFSAN